MEESNDKVQLTPVLTDAMIEAAAKAHYEETVGRPWDDAADTAHQHWRSDARVMLTAALASQPTPPAPAAANAAPVCPSTGLGCTIRPPCGTPYSPHSEVCYPAADQKTIDPFCWAVLTKHDNCIYPFHSAREAHKFAKKSGKNAKVLSLYVGPQTLSVASAAHPPAPSSDAARDAARLDWLENVRVFRASYFPGFRNWTLDADGEFTGVTLRAAIDAAMQGEAGGRDDA